MSEILKVLNRDRVELTSEKVELGLAQDMAKEIANANNEIKNYLKSAGAISSLASKAVADGSSYIKTAVKIDKILTTMKSKANELGVKPEDIKGYKEADALLVRYDPSAVQSKVADFKKF
tara:strand:- start:206 stop:565 length:360 start_codon:yes stop_codon:yes gene_type:complete